MVGAGLGEEPAVELGCGYLSPKIRGRGFQQEVRDMLRSRAEMLSAESSSGV